MGSNRISAAGILVSVALAASQPAHAFLDNLLGSGGTKTKQANAEMGLPEYKGVKHAIGVKDFANEAGWHGEWNLGKNLSTMLESALFDSGRFVVVEREQLGDVIAEQDLQASGRAAKADQVAQTGKIRSAKYIATGAITEVEQNTQGTSGGISIRGIRVGAGGGKSHIACVVKIIDTTTGEIVAKQRVEGKAGKRGLSVGFSHMGVGGDLEGFNKTPIGEAAQDVIIQAVKFIALTMEDYKLDGSVVAVTGDGEVIVNRGSDYGIEPGMAFVVKTRGEKLIDPDSGEVLDEMEGKTVCELEITKVKEKVAYGKITSGAAPERGATATMK